MDDEDAGGGRAHVAFARIRAVEHDFAPSLSLAELGLASIPGEIHRMTWLRELDLSGNDLDRLPRWLCKLTELRVLNISGNQLDDLPDWIVQLRNLETLRAAGNRLLTIPAALGDLRALTVLDVRNNNLAEIPDSLSHIGLQTLLTSGNPRLAHTTAEWSHGDGVEQTASPGGADAQMPTANLRLIAPPPCGSGPAAAVVAGLSAKQTRSKKPIVMLMISVGAVALAGGAVALASPAPARQRGVLTGKPVSSSPVQGSSADAGIARAGATPSARRHGADVSPAPSGSASSALLPSEASMTAALIDGSPSATAPVAEPSTSSPLSAYPAIASTYNDVGITADNATAAGDFDGSDYASFSRQALAAAGAAPGQEISSDGFTFVFPSPPAGSDDNTVSEGQDISVAGSGTDLGFLLSASFGPATGSGAIHYTDGTVESFQLTVLDWFDSSDAPPDGRVAISCTYQNRGGNVQIPAVANIYAESVPLEAGKTLAYVQLPNLGPLTDGDPAIHVFDVELS